MRDPREALEEARRRAASAGAGEEVQSAGFGRSPVTLRQLAEWAMIEPEAEAVYSTRRLGRPITVLKRSLIRLLRQYLDQMSAQQSRFNAHVAAHVMQLEQRVSALEEAAARSGLAVQAPEGRAGERPP